MVLGHCQYGLLKNQWTRLWELVVAEGSVEVENIGKLTGESANPLGCDNGSEHGGWLCGVGSFCARRW